MIASSPFPRLVHGAASSSVMRAARTALAASLLVAATAHASEPAADPRDAYARAHALVDVGGGRLMNLFCTGSGSPTVVFEAGIGSAGWDWVRVHPAVAARTRACVYDRAGYGFSDPSPAPATAAHQVADLHALLAGAGEKPPYVLVGHSLGGRNVQLYAYTYPKEVAGLVILDSDHEDARARGDRITGGKLSQIEGEMLANVRACAEASHKDFGTDPEAARQCIGPLDVPTYGLVLAPVVTRRDASPARWDAIVGEHEQEATASAAQLRAARRPFGNLPLVYLTRSVSPYATPGQPQSDTNRAFEADVKASHDEIAKLSTRGVNRVVPGAGHDLPTEHPEAVIEAINEVLDAR